MIYIPKQINIKLIEVILKQHTHAMTVEILLDYIGQSKKDPSNVHNFFNTKEDILIWTERNKIENGIR